MKILICLDYSSFTEHVLGTIRTIVGPMPDVKITVLHIIDEQLFYATTGFEVQLNETLEKESAELSALCMEYLGRDVRYVEQFGIPKLQIPDDLEEIPHDMVIVGSHSRHGLGERLLGSTAEFVLRRSKKPVLIIP